ncbi:clathrin adaptor mu subunit [Irpex lacteus]|nr:clathrin adaptor mu subunit [Irpex lacteus]
MAIDGVIVLDNSGNPAYPLLHIDALKTALEKAARPADVDPVLYVPSLQHEVPSACCHLKHGDLRFLCPVSGDMDPLYVFAFLRTFIDILREYLGHISAESLRDNFDVVYQLLEETLDASGHPSTTYPNALRDIVLPPSLLQKVLSAAGVNGLASSSSSTHPFASPIPWRKTGVRYNNNEIFFDIIEELRAVMNKNGTPAASNVWSKVLATSKLSGTPDLLLSFANSKALTDCSFHPCVRLPRWARDSHLSFVPPDGSFTLMEYRYVPAGLHPVAVPFLIKSLVNIEEVGAIEKLTLEWYLGDGATGASCIASNNASWAFDPRTQSLRWEVKSMSPSSTYNLRGSFTSTSKHPRPAKAFRVTFEIPQHSFSSLKVEQLKLTGEMYKPYKGVRVKSMGDIEWRW